MWRCPWVMALTITDCFEVLCAHFSDTLDSSPKCLEEKPVLLRRREAKTLLYLVLTDSPEKQLSFDCLGLHNFPNKRITKHSSVWAKTSSSSGFTKLLSVAVSQMPLQRWADNGFIPTYDFCRLKGMDDEDKTNVDFEQFYLSNNMLIIHYMMWYFREFLLHIHF